MNLSEHLIKLQSSVDEANRLLDGACYAENPGQAKEFLRDAAGTFNNVAEQCKRIAQSFTMENDNLPIKPGQILPNGAKVLFVKATEDPNAFVVMCHKAIDDAYEYVTWKCDSSGNCYWGHYFREDKTAAMTNFKNR
jgi:hypothetical protein